MEKTVQEMAQEINEKIESFKGKVEGAATKEALENFKNEINGKLEALPKSEAVTKLQEDVKEALEGLNEIKDMRNQADTPIALSEEIKGNKEAIMKIASGASGEVIVKALTNRAAVSNSTAGYVLPEITQLGHKERSLYNVLPKIQVSDGNHAGVIRYRDWDEATTVRAAAMVAEGAAFPESTAKFQWYSKELRKVGDTLPVTEEFFEDEQQAAAELEQFIGTNVELVVDNQIVNGDNTGQNLDGIMNAAPAYTASASGIAAANLKDLAIKMKNDITRLRGSKYRPDILGVSSSTMEDLVLAKDANNNYIFDENTGTLGGLFVIVDENVADNEIFVGDRRKAVIYEKGGVAISRGAVNAQFTEDEMTLKARKRMLLLIKEGDKSGFRKVTDVAAALTTLAS